MKGFWRVSLAVLLGLGVVLPGAMIAAQDDAWTCDEGPNDIVTAAEAAYEDGDLDTALDLATEAVDLCKGNSGRRRDARKLKANIEKSIREHATVDPECINDTLENAQAAYDAGDLDTALELVTQAEEYFEVEKPQCREARKLRIKVEGDLRERAREEFLASAQPGKVDLGEYELFMACTGAGSPTVIFEHGLGCDSGVWEDIYPAISDLTRACVYDRRGAGLSSLILTDEVRTTQDQVDDLVALLELAEIEGPFILVGHSIAGLNIALFFEQHPDWVEGVVLVDAVHPLLRAYVIEWNPDEPPPPDQCDETDTNERFDRCMSILQTGKFTGFDDRPLVVLTAGYGSDDNWIVMQEDLVSRSTNSRHITAEQSSHLIMGSEPELVIDAILWVLDEVRAAEE